MLEAKLPLESRSCRMRLTSVWYCSIVRRSLDTGNVKYT
jgi:hypothetical protein